MVGRREPSAEAARIFGTPMGTLVYYLTLPPSSTASPCCPSLLYLLDGIYVTIYHVFGYRKQVVWSNLRNSFRRRARRN